MILSKERIPSLVLWTFLTVFLFTSCAHKRAYKKAVEYEKSGRYVEAAEKDLEALDKKPDFTDAQEHLQFVAPKAYQELLSRAEGFESNFQWIEAVDTYRRLDLLLNRFRRHHILLETVDIPGRISHAREEGKEYYYRNGERYFQKGRYYQAIEQYENVNKISGFYLDTKEKLWEAYVRLGNQALASERFQAAIDRYQAARKYAADVSANDELIAEAYYQWAEKLAAEEKYRKAHEKFEKLLEIAPDYRDASRRAREVFEKALRRVAILPFRNATPYGRQYSNLLTEELINNCIKTRLKYSVFITRDHLDQILEEYKLALSGVVDESKAAEIGKLEGIHSFVTGTITQISEEVSRPGFVEKTHQKVYTVTDTAGNEIKKTRTIYYREYTSRRTVRIAASYQIVDVQTGRYLSGDNFVEKITDEARWVRYSGSIYDLPRDKQKLMDAPQEPRSADVMINDGIRQIARKMSKKILKFYR